MGHNLKAQPLPPLTFLVMCTITWEPKCHLKPKLTRRECKTGRDMEGERGGEEGRENENEFLLAMYFAHFIQCLTFFISNGVVVVFGRNSL